MLSSVVCEKKEILDPLHDLGQCFESKMEEVNSFLSNCSKSDLEELPLISQYLIQSGGKRIRPVLTLAASALCGYKGNRDVLMASCIEILHTATLLHDDVVDESPLRRGKPSAHTIWGNQLSVLGGDFLLAKLFQYLVSDGDISILNLFVSTTQKIVEGEVIQIKTALSATMDESLYFRMIESKTASLFGAAIEIGGLLARVSDNQQNALKTYAMNLGTAFQLIDDLLDYLGDEKTFGKSLGKDFSEGKITLPLIRLHQYFDGCNLEKKLRLETILKKGLWDQENFEWIVSNMISNNIQEKIYETANQCGKIAREALEQFELSTSTIKDLLSELTHFVVHRLK